MGRNSVTIDGIPVGETGSIVTPLEGFGEDSSRDEIIGSPPRRPSTSAGTSSSSTNRKRSHPEKSGISEVDAKRKTLQNNLMEIKIYKARLECLRLEGELMLPHSEFTSPLF